MSRRLARRLLERDRGSRICPDCGGPRGGHGLCAACEQRTAEELELEEAEWWVEEPYEEPAYAGVWDDDDDWDLPF
jgi:NMD protein affecting ribosome stability and mRNA decay